MPVLLAGLKDARVEVAVASAELLSEVATPETVVALLVALKYATRPVQLAARKVLGQSGRAAVPLLREGRLAEPQPWVRQQLVAALAEAEEGARTASVSEGANNATDAEEPN